MRALIIKEFRELLRDRRTLAMLIVMPVILLVVFGYAANFNVDKISVTVIGGQAREVAADIRSLDAGKDDIDIVKVDGNPSLGRGEAESILRNRRSDAVVVSQRKAGADDTLNARMLVYVDGTQLFTAQASNRVFLGLVSQDTQNRVERLQKTIAKTSDDAARTQEALKKYVGQLQEFRNQLGAALAAGRTLPAVPTPPVFAAPSAVATVSLPSIQTTSIVHVLFNPDLKTSWVMVPGLIGLILTLIGTVVTSIGLVRERESGTLEQLAVMPLRPASIIMGKIVPYFILALMDMLIITVLGIWLFKVPFVGSVPIFALGVALFLFVVLGLGVMISSLSQTTGQAIQMALMITMPQILLSGLIFPLSSMAVGVHWIGYVLPLTWFIVVSQGVMLRGAELSSLWIALTILAAQAVVIFGAATLRMRRLLTHGGSR